MTGFKSELYIHERHRGHGSPQQKLIKQRGLQVLQAEDEVDSPMTSSINQTVSSSVKNFSIGGIVDPRTKQKISISQALSRGIINKDTGMYNNPETGLSISIAEAIAKGLISVEYGDSLSNGGVGESSNSLGALNSLETKTFAISGVVDPKTGETISAKEAIAAGLLDLKSGKFSNVFI